MAQQQQKRQVDRATQAIIDKIAGAEVGANRNYLKRGDYIATLGTVRYNNGYNGLAFVIEFTIDKALKTCEYEPSEVGEESSQAYNLTDPKMYGHVSVKKFLLAASGKKDATKEEIAEVATELLDNDQFLSGVKVRIKVEPKKEGSDAAYPEFYPV